MPVIAAVHGVAFGGGFQLALGADMRFVTPDARLAILEIKWGLVPDMAGTQLMRHLVREDIVRELTYTGRVFSGEEARPHRLRDPRVRRSARRGPRRRARDRRERTRTPSAPAKRLLNAAPLRSTPPPASIQETEEQIALIGSANQVEAVRANLEKREPTFADVAD